MPGRAFRRVGCRREAERGAERRVEGVRDGGREGTDPRMVFGGDEGPDRTGPAEDAEADASEVVGRVAARGVDVGQGNRIRRFRAEPPEETAVGQGEACVPETAPFEEREEEQKKMERNENDEERERAVDGLGVEDDVTERRVCGMQDDFVAEAEPPDEQGGEKRGEKRCPDDAAADEGAGVLRRRGIRRALPEDAFAVFERPGGSGEDATGTARGASTPPRPENAFPTLSHNFGKSRSSAIEELARAGG